MTIEKQRGPSGLRVCYGLGLQISWVQSDSLLTETKQQRLSAFFYRMKGRRLKQQVEKLTDKVDRTGEEDVGGSFHSPQPCHASPIPPFPDSPIPHPSSSGGGWVFYPCLEYLCNCRIRLRPVVFLQKSQVKSCGLPSDVFKLRPVFFSTK